MHNLVPGSSYSRNWVLDWKISPRFKHIELKNMKMKGAIWSRSKPFQASIRVQSFISKLEEKIWSWRSLESTESTHCSSRGWKFDHLNSCFYYHSCVDLGTLRILMLILLKTVENCMKYVHLKFFHAIFFPSICIC